MKFTQRATERFPVDTVVGLSGFTRSHTHRSLEFPNVLVTPQNACRPSEHCLPSIPSPRRASPVPALWLAIGGGTEGAQSEHIPRKEPHNTEPLAATCPRFTRVAAQARALPAYGASGPQSVHPLAEGHLGGSHLQALVSSDVINIRVRFLRGRTCFHFSGSPPGVGALGPAVTPSSPF